jgi:hypothetical protein
MKKSKIIMLLLVTLFLASILTWVRLNSGFSSETKLDPTSLSHNSLDLKVSRGQAAEPKKKSLGARTILPSPVWVIGSYDKNGQPNAMTFAWARWRLWPKK